MKQLITRHAQWATVVFFGSFTASLGYVTRLGGVGIGPYSHGAFPRHRYTLTTGRSALTDAKAWLGATTMTDEAVLAESDRRYQMRLSR
jgi:hypothetical protein